MITKEVFDKFLEMYSSTHLSKKKVCRELHVSDASIDVYMETVGEDAIRQYARAIDIRTESLVDRIRDIEDDCLDECKLCEDPKRLTSIVQTYRMMVDNIKWEASKLKSKKYGDRLDLTSGGEKLPSPPTELLIRIKE